MPDKIHLITGANTGIGKAIATGLAKSGAHLILVCRDLQKGTAVQQELKKLSNSTKIDLFVADLSSQQDIRQLSENIHHHYSYINVLINNAGVSLKEKTLSVDGIEMNLATNHLGPFLLTHLLRDLLQAGSPSRVINISSSAHQWAKIDLEDLQFQKRTYHAMQAYAQSKLFLTMMSYEFAKRLQGVTVNALHPGVINTKLLDEIALNYLPDALRKIIEKPLIRLLQFLFMTPEAAAKPVIDLATANEFANTTGKYFVKHQLVKSSKKSYDTQLAATIWKLSEAMAGLHE